jgi:hypothetical protein
VGRAGPSFTFAFWRAALSPAQITDLSNAIRTVVSANAFDTNVMTGSDGAVVCVGGEAVDHGVGVGVFHVR